MDVDFDAKRGDLQRAEPGARGLEHAARNPRCDRLTALTLVSASVSELAGKRLGAPVVDQGSPFALLRGQRFEAIILANDAQILLGAYTEEKLIEPGGDWDVVDASKLHPDDLDARRAFSDAQVGARMTQGVTKGLLLVKPRFTLSVGGREFGVEPDALIAAPGERTFRVQEVKSYGFRGGLTSSSKTVSALRQAACGHLALVAAMKRAGGQGPDVAEADLIFARPGTNHPVPRRMRLDGEIASLTRMIERHAPRVLARIEDFDGTIEDLIGELPFRLCEDCRDHCPMLAACRREAIASDDPAVLGDMVREQLTGVDALDDAVDLLNAAVAPSSQAQMQTARMLQTADRWYQEGHS